MTAAKQTPRFFQSAKTLMKRSFANKNLLFRSHKWDFSILVGVRLRNFYCNSMFNKRFITGKCGSGQLSDRKSTALVIFHFIWVDVFSFVTQLFMDLLKLKSVMTCFFCVYFSVNSVLIKNSIFKSILQSFYVFSTHKLSVL